MAYDYLLGFLDQSGNTSAAGQTNAGVFEKQQGWTPAPQQAHENSEAYQARVNAK